jgi:hypothetical protein
MARPACPTARSGTTRRSCVPASSTSILLVIPATPFPVASSTRRRLRNRPWPQSGPSHLTSLARKRRYPTPDGNSPASGRNATLPCRARMRPARRRRSWSRTPRGTSAYMAGTPSRSAAVTRGHRAGSEHRTKTGDSTPVSHAAKGDAQPRTSRMTTGALRDGTDNIRYPSRVSPNPAGPVNSTGRPGWSWKRSCSGS